MKCISVHWFVPNATITQCYTDPPLISLLLKSSRRPCTVSFYGGKQSLYHAVYSITIGSIFTLKWTWATSVGRKQWWSLLAWARFFFQLSFFLVSLRLQNYPRSRWWVSDFKSHKQCWVMSAGGPGVRSPHGISWQDDLTLRTGIQISPGSSYNCWHQLISQTAAWLVCCN